MGEIEEYLISPKIDHRLVAGTMPHIADLTSGIHTP